MTVLNFYVFVFYVRRYIWERIYLSSSALPLPLVDANICIDGSIGKGGKVTVSRPSASDYNAADESVFRFANDPDPSYYYGKPQPVEFCFYNLAIEGGYNGITDEMGYSGSTETSSFIQMDVVNCHFEDQGNDSIDWDEVTVSLLRVVGSTFLDGGDDFIDIDDDNGDPCTQNANKIEIVNSHFENSYDDCVELNGAFPPLSLRMTLCAMSSFIHSGNIFFLALILTRVEARA